MVSHKSTVPEAPPYQVSAEDDLDNERVPQYSVEENLSTMNLNSAEPAQGNASEAAPVLDIKEGDIVIAVMGITGSGKSTFISHFAKGVVVGHTLEACTSTVGIYECNYDKKTKVYFVDTPGFDDTYKSDTDILREIADWLSQAYSNKIKLSGIVYLHRILDVRLGGSAMKNLRMFKKLCGDDALSSVVLATTWWSGVSQQVGIERERQLTSTHNFWATMIAKGSKVFRQDDGAKSARKIVDYLIKRQHLVNLKIVEELNDDNKTLDQTGAGIEVDSQLAAQKIEFEKKLFRIEEDMRQAMRDKDEEFQNELLAFKKETQDRMAQAEKDSAKLQADKDQLRREMEAQLAEERQKLVQQIEANTRRVMDSQHELQIMEMRHASEMAKKELAFKLEKETAESKRLAMLLKEEKEKCIVM